MVLMWADKGTALRRSLYDAEIDMVFLGPQWSVILHKVFTKHYKLPAFLTQLIWRLVNNFVMQKFHLIIVLYLHHHV